MKKMLPWLAIVAGACLVAWLWTSNQRLRREVDSLQQMRWSRVRAILGPCARSVASSDDDALRNGYARIAEAYLNGDRLGMAVAMAALPTSGSDVRWNISVRHDAPLSTAFDDTFLRTDDLRDFQSAESFESFAWINLDLAAFYGRLFLRQNRFESLCCVECLVHLRLMQYHDKFVREGRTGLQDVARRFTDLWEAHIDSPDGFTKQGVRGMYLMNTVYARACGHGPGLSRENALAMARSLANGLVKCGYRPQWLDHLDDVLDEPVDGIMPDDYNDDTTSATRRAESR